MIHKPLRYYLLPWWVANQIIFNHFLPSSSFSSLTDFCHRLVPWVDVQVHLSRSDMLSIGFVIIFMEEWYEWRLILALQYSENSQFIFKSVNFNKNVSSWSHYVNNIFICTKVIFKISIWDILFCSFKELISFFSILYEEIKVFFLFCCFVFREERIF